MIELVRNSSREMYSPIILYDDTQGTIKNTSAFNTKSSSGIRREIENNKRSKEAEDKEL